MTAVDMVNMAATLIASTGMKLRKTDYSGFYDWLHPFGVAERVKHYGETAQTVALLHDCIEDYNITNDMLLSMHFPEEVVNAVVALTRNDPEEYFDYLNRLATNPLAIIVKIADLQYNLNRVDYGVPVDRANKLRNRWVAAMELLRDRLAVYVRP